MICCGMFDCNDFLQNCNVVLAYGCFTKKGFLDHPKESEGEILNSIRVVQQMLMILIQILAPPGTLLGCLGAGVSLRSPWALGGPWGLPGGPWVSVGRPWADRSGPWGSMFLPTTTLLRILREI